MFTPGLTEIVVGKNANISYAGLTLGNTISLGSVRWLIVGVFDAGGSAFDSEIWGDAHLIGPAYNRPDTFFQSITVHLASADSLQLLKDALTTDPRLNVDVTREIDYYSKQSTRLTKLIEILGGLVAAIMAIGAVFGALNTMYSAVSERGREIATMRAIGFGGPSVVFSFVIEALLIAFVGGLIGCIAVLPLNGLTTGAMNLQTFSHLAFAFKITPELLVKGIIFALAMGVVGGLLPAIRAAVQPVATSKTTPAPMVGELVRTEKSPGWLGTLEINWGFSVREWRSYVKLFSHLEKSPLEVAQRKSSDDSGL
jgi:putative ABC transport system permease protein